MSSSPRALLTAVTVLLDVITATFARFALRINLSNGKTESLLKLRGKNSSACLDTLRCDGGLSFAIAPPYDDQRLSVVEKYKYLGSVITISESVVFDAQHRACAALSAYVPSTSKIFGSREVSQWLKLHFTVSLILKRLLYNTQTWVVCTFVVALREINGVYMRVLRMIAGESRFQRCEHTDVKIRTRLSQPSIDCLLMRRRLLFAGRIVRAPSCNHCCVVAFYWRARVPLGRAVCGSFPVFMVKCA